MIIAKEQYIKEFCLSENYLIKSENGPNLILIDLRENNSDKHYMNIILFKEIWKNWDYYSL